MNTTEPAVADIERDPMWYRTYKRVQAVLDEALGTEAEDVGGEGTAADVALLASQRDAARRELEDAVRERTTAEATLARIATHCRRRLDTAIVQGPVSDLCRNILDILGSEEEEASHG